MNQSISENTVQAVRDLPILDVISSYLPDLKKKGSTWICKSPFNQEKTPSFNVIPAKNIWKDFSSDLGGDHIKFVMEFKKLDFIEAVKDIADRCQVTIEYDNLTFEKAKAIQKKAAVKKATAQALDVALEFFRSQKMPADYLATRKWTKIADTFQLGMTGEKSDALVNHFKGLGFTAKQLQDSGLVGKNEKGEFYDFFRDRVMIPIYDESGKLVAFTGRDITGKAKAKYFNSPDSCWNKGLHLYGLHLAAAAIRSEGCAFLVEGQPDVMAMHRRGHQNTVCPGGSGLTDDQIKKLKRHTDKIIIIPDTDAAGMKALHRNAELLIQAGLKVFVQIPGRDAKDVDEYLKSATTGELKKFMADAQEYISQFMLIQLMTKAEASVHDKADAITKMGSLVEMIPSETLRNAMHDAAGKDWPDYKKSYKLQKRSDAEYQHLQKLAAQQRTEFDEFGFFLEDGVWMSYKGKQKIRICNFTIEVLYFVFSGNESKYVCRLKNVNGVQHVVPITTDDFVSVNTFAKVVARYGNFIFEAGQEELNKIRVKLFTGVKMSREPHHLGWDENGKFYCWANGLWYGKDFFKADKYGIVGIKRPVLNLKQLQRIHPEEHILINDDLVVLNNPQEWIEDQGEEQIQDKLDQQQIFHLVYFYLPFAASQRISGDSDDFDMIRKFRHFDKAPDLNFETWADTMLKVYGDSGMILIAFYVATLYRSHIFKCNNNYFPILMHFGVRGSGKSKAAESISAMFGEVIEDGVNLESGSTPTGIRRYMSSVQDGLIWLNEYKNTLPGHTLGMLKGIADGSAKLTGIKSSGNETKSYKPKSAAVMCGQDLPTQDPALLSRGIILEFAKDDKKNVTAYEQLKGWEKQGCGTSITCSMIKHRAVMEKAYEATARSLEKDLKKDMQMEMGFRPDDRAVLNIATIISPIKILMEAGLIQVPFTVDQLIEIAKDKVKFQIEIQHTSDDVEQYLMVLQSLIGKGMEENKFWKIEKTPDGMNALFIRVKPVHPFYLEAAKRQGVTPLGSSTIRNYLKRHRAFIKEEPKNVRFSKLANTTSAMLLDYDMLRNQGIEFETIDVISDGISQLEKDLFQEFDQMPASGSFTADDLSKHFQASCKILVSPAQVVEVIKKYNELSGRKMEVIDMFGSFEFKPLSK